MKMAIKFHMDLKMTFITNLHKHLFTIIKCSQICYMLLNVMGEKDQYEGKMAQVAEIRQLVYFFMKIAIFIYKAYL